MEKVTVLVCSNHECGGTHHLNEQGEICRVKRLPDPPSGDHVGVISPSDCLAGSGITITQCASPECGCVVAITGRLDDNQPYPHSLASNITVTKGTCLKGDKYCNSCQRQARKRQIGWLLHGRFVPEIWDKMRTKVRPGHVS